jgi:hypothetical protein
MSLILPLNALAVYSHPQSAENLAGHNGYSWSYPESQGSICVSAVPNVVPLRWHDTADNFVEYSTLKTEVDYCSETSQEPHIQESTGPVPCRSVRHVCIYRIPIADSRLISRRYVDSDTVCPVVGGRIVKA